MTDPIDTTPLWLQPDDGTDVYVYRWLPIGAPVRAVVQVVHGAAEHAGRYDRLARDLVAAGYGVYASDHRGHGRTAGSVEKAGIAGPDGWNRMLADERLLTETASAAHPGAPVVLLGHSMGSLLGQHYAQTHGSALDALILSGTASALPEGAEDLADRVAQALARDGADAPSEDFGLLFAGFNEPFTGTVPAEAVTGFEWLSRDPAEVGLYVDDPFCGFPFSNGLVLDMARALDDIWSPGAAGRIPASLPILLIAGAEDPVGENEGVHQLGERYRAAGLDVTEKLYPGARHEIFNETNLQEVHDDVLAWLDPRFPA